jgi:hypothetical protein
MIRLVLVQGKLDSRPRQLANDERDSLRNPLVRLSRMVVLDNYSLAFGPSFASERFASQFFPAEAKPRMRFGKFFWTDSGAERGLGGIAVSYSRANWPI